MEKHMQIYLNGELTQTACHNLLQLVQELALEGKRFAVEQNEKIVPKSQLEQSPLSAHDRIEIIHAVGGG